MKVFDELPKSVKKTIRYIHQDVKTLEKLTKIEKELLNHLKQRKEVLRLGR